MLESLCCRKSGSAIRQAMRKDASKLACLHKTVQPPGRNAEALFRKFDRLKAFPLSLPAVSGNKQMAKVTVNHIYKIYPGEKGTNVTAVEDVNLEIADREFVVLVGPSGCGKSTTLRMIAGLEEISRGDIYIGDRRVNDVPPKDRDIAMVFQNYALYPHMNVFDNMAFGLRLRKYAKTEIKKRVNEPPAFLGSKACSIANPRRFPVGNASASPWAAPSCGSRKFFYSMSRFQISMRKCECRCAQKLQNCISVCRRR